MELDWKDYVVVDEKHFRPNEVKYLLGDSSKARKELSWKPKTTFDELVEMMVKSDLKLAESEKSPYGKRITDANMGITYNLGYLNTNCK